MPEFADSSPLRLFVSKHIWNGIPTEWEYKLALAGSNHACEAWRYFRTEGDFAVATIGECIGLLVDDLVACLCAEKFSRLENGGIIFFITILFRNVPPDTKNVFLNGHIGWEEITDAFVWLSGKLFGFGFAHVLHCSQYMSGKQENIVTIYKNLGETPLEALERFRVTRPELKDIPMTYAGRLDPLAEGDLIILIGDECKNKDAYLGLDKEYEVEVVLGISTDTHDALGLAEISRGLPSRVGLDVQKYVGKFSQPYPAYSSKTVNGVQLHELSRRNELPDVMPKKNVEVYKVELLSRNEISATELKSRILHNIDLVKGDFRQEEIKKRWEEVFRGLPSRVGLDAIRFRVKCSSGTYMRSLADRIGKDLGCGAFCLSIKRTKILLTSN